MLDPISSERGSRQTRASAAHGGTPPLRIIGRGTIVAGQSRLSLYAPNLKLGYVWRGRENRLAARLKAKLDELGIS